MERVIERLQAVNVLLEKIQSILNFEGWTKYPQFSTTKGLGRVALISTILGMTWGIHAGFFLLLLGIQRIGFPTTTITTTTTEGEEQQLRLQMGIQYCVYMCSMSTFHLLEFFTTAIFNPHVTSSESFLVNHSKAYSAAFLISLLEFWIRFIFFPQTSITLFLSGTIFVVLAQIIRSWSMITCGESFNHLIQTSKRENHVLIKHGIYKYLRHPSYVGFYYWSIATQLTLNNWCSAALFALASLIFFRRRIPYEEKSLMEHFPEEYVAYARTTWVGIPFIPNSINASSIPNRNDDHKKD